MRKQLTAALLLLNAALAAGLYLRSAANTADAQPVPGQTPRRAEFIAVPGAVSGLSSSVIFILDTGSATLGAIAPDNKGMLESMPGKINLNELATLANDAARPPERGTRRNRN
jgi:hypothetical protein